MAGTWLVDGNRIATKIRSASDPGRVTWKSNPTRSCPNCNHVIDNSDVNQAWPGLPRGVKFDPSDQEIIWHLRTKVGVEDSRPHIFINEFIPTIENEDGICYTHPQKLPGVKEDGSVSHFFHRAIKAYNTGTRKRRKIHGDDFGDVRWHKTGRTKPVMLDGAQRGCKKIMVLYMTTVKGGKAEKTNWVMHQYHLGTEEDEKDGEYVISKIFHQQPQMKQVDKTEQDSPEMIDSPIVTVVPVTPMSVTPDPPPRTGRQCPEYDQEQDYTIPCINPSDQVFAAKHPTMQHLDDEVQAECETSSHCDLLDQEVNEMLVNNDNNYAGEDPQWWEGESQYLLDSQQLVEGLSLCDELLQSQSPKKGANVNDGILDGKPRLSDYAELGAELVECETSSHSDLPDREINEILVNNDNDDNHAGEDPQWWEGESQYLLDSQQLVEGLCLCDELLQSQSPKKGANVNDGILDGKPRLSDYAQLGTEHLKKDLEDCQNLEDNPANIELDTPPEFRLSQLDFESQDSCIPWGWKAGDCSTG